MKTLHVLALVALGFSTLIEKSVKAENPKAPTVEVKLNSEAQLALLEEVSKKLSEEISKKNYSDDVKKLASLNIDLTEVLAKDPKAEANMNRIMAGGGIVAVLGGLRIFGDAANDSFYYPDAKRKGLRAIVGFSLIGSAIPLIGLGAINEGVTTEGVASSLRAKREELQRQIYILQAKVESERKNIVRAGEAASELLEEH